MKNDLGMSRDEAGVIRAKCKADGLPDPFDAYRKHRQNAEQRGIEWGFTFATWWAIWAAYYRLRGKGKNALCMARNGDNGPYAPGNVYLTTSLGNGEDKKHGAAVTAKKAARREAEIERGGAPVGYAWKHPGGARKADECRSEAMKQTQKQAEYLACIADGDVLE